jgi:hypothetical protein
MGQEFSCATRGKQIAGALEDGFDRALCDADNALDAVEKVIEDATRDTPAKPSCELSDKERTAAIHLFWVLVREQGGGTEVGGAPATVHEDLTMALCLKRLRLLEAPLPAAAKGVAGPSSGLDEDMLEAERLLVAMFRQLHAFPVGQWVRGHLAGHARRQYRLDEWVTLLEHLQRFVTNADLLPPPGVAPWSHVAACPSVQVHACHTALRECEALRDALLDKLARDPSLETRHIIVMTPDVATYGPLVQAVLS